MALFSKEFSTFTDEREPWRVANPLAEVLLLLTCVTVASCDDFDDIVAWSEHHLDFMRKFAPYHHGVPCQRWLRTLVNLVDPMLFGRCFEAGSKAVAWAARPHRRIGSTLQGMRRKV